MSHLIAVGCLILLVVVLVCIWWPGEEKKADEAVCRLSLKIDSVMQTVYDIGYKDGKAGVPPRDLAQEVGRKPLDRSDECHDDPEA